MKTESTEMELILSKKLIFPEKIQLRIVYTTEIMIKAIPNAEPPRGTDVLRFNIGIFGSMNAGKSTLMNLLTQQKTSIVDSTPGTTADVKVAVMELHQLGPCKLFDTAGVDEAGILGDKKREKSTAALKESNLVVIVVNAASEDSVAAAADVLRKAGDLKKPAIIVFRTVEDKDNIELTPLVRKAYHLIIESNKSERIPSTTLDLTNPKNKTQLVRFLYNHHSTEYKKHVVPPVPVDAIPYNSTVLLNIPMDLETPGGRLLKPQALIVEYLLRSFVNVMCFRMDLGKGRSDDLEIVKKEKKRWRDMIDLLGDDLSLVITDSQAIDLVHPWTLDDETGEEIAKITTFSIAMANYKSGGNLEIFAEGIRHFSKVLKEKESGKEKRRPKFLICEACNHERIVAEGLDDIGTVQIPKKLKALFNDEVDISWAFGREYESVLSNIDEFDVVMHCGGCMLDQQKMMSRLNDLFDSGVHVTNYGLILSILKSEDALRRVLKPWKIEL